MYTILSIINNRDAVKLQFNFPECFNFLKKTAMKKAKVVCSLKT